MLVPALGVAAHAQQATVRQAQFEPMRVAPAATRTQQETARRAQAQRRDHRALAQFRLVVAVPAHGVRAVAVEIGQHAVEAHPAGIAHALVERRQHRRPRMRLEAGTRVDVGRLRIADPAAQPRRGHLAAEHPDAVVLPGHRLLKSGEQRVRMRGRQPVVDDRKLRAGQRQRPPCGPVHRTRIRRSPDTPARRPASRPPPRPAPAAAGPTRAHRPAAGRSAGRPARCPSGCSPPGSRPGWRSW